MSAPTTAPAAEAPLLEVRGLKVRLHLGERTVTALDGVDITVRRGECVGLVGESGSGKSTCARAASRLLPNVRSSLEGSVSFEGQDVLGMDERRLRALRRAGGFSMIFQDPLGHLDPTLRVGRQIEDALTRDEQAGPAGARVARLLDDVGLPDPHNLARRYPHELSGGMRQRVMIAIALASAPKLLFADEPTTALDVTVQLQVLQTLYRLHRERHMAMLIITHDLGVVAEMCDRVYVMRAGKVVEHGSTAALFAQPEHPYTSRLISLSRQHAGAELLP